MQIDSYVSERQRKRKKRRAYFYSFIGMLVVYFILAGIGWLIFGSPLFTVNKVIVQGNSDVSSDAIISLLQASADPRGNFFTSFLGFKSMLLWPDRLSDANLALIPQLESVSIDKDYFSHTITATVTERTPFAIWCLMSSADGGAVKGNEECYWVDNTGTVFARAFDTEGSLLFAVHDYSQVSLGLDQKILPDEFYANAISILNVLKESNLKVNEVALKDLSLEEIDVTTFNGPDVYFSLRFPADDDLQVIQSIMNQAGFAKLSYIDCRTENRVYYK